MKLHYGSSILADGIASWSSGLSLDGTQVNDRADLVRAVSARFFPRGNRSYQLSLRVTRSFDTLRAAGRFVVEHMRGLATQADLSLYIGSDADGEWATGADAVLSSCLPMQRGSSVEVAYSFLVSEITLDSPDPATVEPDSSMIKRSTASITSGATSVTVSFAAPFASTPVVTCSMQSPAGGDALFAWVRDGSVSTTGFIADISAPTPSSAYKISWIASA